MHIRAAHRIDTVLAGLVVIAAACSAPRDGAPLSDTRAPDAAGAGVVASNVSAATDKLNALGTGAATVTVYKSPSCGCCSKWVEHLREHGFHVTTRDTADLPAVKSKYGVPDNASSCHTATVAGYVVEGHVPADVIRRLLEERPEVTGIAVPGMPMGSPGMEGPYHDRYDVLSFTQNGTTRVYTSR